MFNSVSKTAQKVEFMSRRIAIGVGIFVLIVGLALIAHRLNLLGLIRQMHGG